MLIVSAASAATMMSYQKLKTKASRELVVSAQPRAVSSTTMGYKSTRLKALPSRVELSEAFTACYIFSKRGEHEGGQSELIVVSSPFASSPGAPPGSWLLKHLQGRTRRKR